MSNLMDLINSEDALELENSVGDFSFLHSASYADRRHVATKTKRARWTSSSLQNAVQELEQAAEHIATNGLPCSCFDRGFLGALNTSQQQHSDQQRLSSTQEPTFQLQQEYLNDDEGFIAAQAELHAEALQQRQDLNRMPHAPRGPGDSAVAELGAFIVASKAVPSLGSEGCGCDVHGCQEPAVVQCRGCKQGGMQLCANHDKQQHQHAHEHYRQSLTSGFKQPVRPTQHYNEVAEQWEDVVMVFNQPPCQSCSCGKQASVADWRLDASTTEQQRKPLIIVTGYGRLDFCKAYFRCAHCGQGRWQQWQEFVQLQYFPASMDVRNCTFVTVVELDRIRGMQRQAPSWRGLAATIDKVGAKRYNQVKRVDPESLDMAYQLFRLTEHHIEQCRGQHRWECPVCAVSLHSAHADGNMKVWVKDGRQVNHTSRYEHDCGAIFVRDRDVECMAQLVADAGGHDTRQDKLCGRNSFTAAGDRASSAKGKLLSGRFILGCSHLMILKMANMPAALGGERYVYPLIMAAELAKRQGKFFFGDLVCKWYPWMQKMVDKIQQLLAERPEAAAADLAPHLLLTRQELDAMRPATSAVHSYTHVWYCQVLFGPLYQLGVGLENGEFTELINSFISKLALAVRNMSIGRSTDFLTELAWDWNWDKILGLPEYVQNRYVDAVDKLSEAEAVWAKAAGHAQRLRGAVLSEAEIMAIGADIRAAAAEPGGLTSKEMKAVNERIKGLKGSLSTTVTKYNTVRLLGTAHRPADVTTEQVINGEFPWAYRGTEDGTEAGALPFKEKLRVWEAYNRQLRAKEHVSKVLEDAKAFLQYYRQLQLQLDPACPPHMGWLLRHADDSNVQAGLAALVEEGRAFVLQQLAAGDQLLQRLQRQGAQASE